MTTTTETTSDTTHAKCSYEDRLLCALAELLELAGYTLQDLPEEHADDLVQAIAEDYGLARKDLLTLYQSMKLEEASK